MNPVDITILSEKVIAVLRERGCKEKTIKEFERYGLRRVISYLKENGCSVFNKVLIEEFVYAERQRMDNGALSGCQWRATRRAAVFLEQMASDASIQEVPMKKWNVIHNPLFRQAEANLVDSNRIQDVVCLTRDAVMNLELSEKTKANYLYCGFGAILKHFEYLGEDLYSPEILNQFVVNTRDKWNNNLLGRSAFQNIYKCAKWIEEYVSTGKVSLKKHTPFNFCYTAPDFERLIQEYSAFIEHEGYLKVSTLKAYISSVRRFFRRMEKLNRHKFSEITLFDVTKCISLIADECPCSVFGCVQNMRSFANFISNEHPDYLDITPALIFTAAKRKRVYFGYTEDEAQKILDAVDMNSVCGKRDYALMMIAHTTGMRGCDIVNLKFENIDWVSRELRLVQKKTNVPLALPFDTATGNAIADYILHSRPESTSEYVFLRTQRPFTKLSGMYTLVAKYARSVLGKDRRMNGPHAFRRGMGQRLVESDVPSHMICDVLGHTTATALRQYTSASLEKLKTCAEPLDGIPLEQEELL